ncbi:MAG: zinc ribbon domain-containing protein [Butyrivibrio sp.]|nr:zinc ribbon domain-containing protein [Butyrivibrio sp.]
MFCVNCGNRLPENSRFCNMCGTDLSNRIAPPAPGAATPGGYSMQQGGNQHPAGYQSGNVAAMPLGSSDSRFGQPAGFGQQGGGLQGGFAQQGVSQQQGFGQSQAFPQQQFYPQQQIYPQQGFDNSGTVTPAVGFVPPAEQSSPQGFAPANPDEVIMDAGKVTFYTSEKAMVVGGSGKLRIFPDRIEYQVISGSQAGFAFGPLIGGAMMMKKKGKVEEFYFDRIKDVRIAKHMGMMSKVVLEFKDGKTCAFMPMEKGSKTNSQSRKIHDTIKKLIG